MPFSRFRGNVFSPASSIKMQKKPISPMKTDLAPSKAALIGAASIRNMERFLDDIEQRVAAGEISAEDGYQLAQQHQMLCPADSKQQGVFLHSQNFG